MPLHRIPRALDGRTAVVRLFDAYAGFLTARQRDMLRMYYHDDLSLGEIAAGVGVTRQAVFDSLRRSVGDLRGLEKQVGVLAHRQRQARMRETAMKRLAAVEREVARLAASGHGDLSPLRGALRALRAQL
ncbi:MAG TPA: sigma factor-like helix-turn-helix DNA-binding protein [bacterium]|nr:sigma factor-like helix-turn-helix DNA-binding protein [bacterium]